MSIASIVSRLIQFYSILIFVYVLMSWFRPQGFLFEVYRALETVCEPYIGLFRRLLRPVMPAVGLDFSPLAALLALQFIIGPLLVRILVGLSL